MQRSQTCSFVRFEARTWTDNQKPKIYVKHCKPCISERKLFLFSVEIERFLHVPASGRVSAGSFANGFLRGPNGRLTWQHMANVQYVATLVNR